MNIFLTVYNTPSWHALVNSIGLKATDNLPVSTTENCTVSLPQALSSLSKLVESTPNNLQVWIAAVQAEYFLVDALENGGTLVGASQQWIQLTTALLDLQRQQRRKLKLFNLHQALAQPKQFRQLLAPDLTINNYPAHPVVSNFSLLAACQYVAQQPELQKLNTLMQASVLPVCESEVVTVNIEQILLQNRTHNAAAQERDLILSQLHTVQEELEQYYLALQAEQQQHKHALLARDKQQAKEITKLEAELRKTKARAANAEYAGQLIQQELDKLRASISWKAATPVRVLGRLVKKNDPAREKLMQEIGLLLTSEYFDVDWYLRTYTDVAENQMNPAEHYLLHGAKEGRLPGPLFDGNWYLQHYPDVAENNMNPLLHFVMYGQQEGRTSSPKLLTNNQNAEE